MEGRCRAKRITNGIVNAILVGAIATFLFTYGGRFIAERTFSSASISPDGKTITIESIDFSKTDQTVLLALDRNCRFCKEETPFYKRLAENSLNKSVRVVGVFQHELEDGKKYLITEGIPLSETTRIRFKTLLIDSTPTVLLLNRKGEIIGRWTGGLSEPIRDFIISILGVNEDLIRQADSPYLELGNRTPPPLIDAASLKAKLKTENTSTLLDIDDRIQFAQRHINGAVNIPADEVYARAQNELAQSRLIVLYARGYDSRRIINAKFTLQQLGFRNIAWLRSTLEESRSVGLEIIEGRGLAKSGASQ